MPPGRPPTPPVILPDISQQADALASWLHQTEGAQRRPEATAKILALAVVLYLANKSWPTRQQIKGHIGVSKAMVDLVLSQRQAKGQLTVRTATVPGNVKKHASVITLRYLDPSQQLIDAVGHLRESAPVCPRSGATSLEQPR